jgi:predicted AlkP superfamily pyrophosphatase or phosphodiesterase
LFAVTGVVLTITASILHAAGGLREGASKKSSGRKAMMRAILIIIDGCRTDALQQASTPNIDLLAAEGACSLDAATVQPSITLPVHFSIFTSQKPTEHNVMTNTGRPALSPSATTLFDQVKTFGKTTAAVYSWENLRNLSPPGALDYSFYLNTADRQNRDLGIAMGVADCLRQFQPDFLFVYLGGLDKTGHEAGWMSKAYLEALHQADSAVGIVLETMAATGLDTETDIILHSDHGGAGNDHQTPVPENLTIPWIAFGPDICKGHPISTPVSVLDTVPTLAHLLGIPPHYSWEGRLVTEILNARQIPASAEKAA